MKLLQLRRRSSLLVLLLLFLSASSASLLLLRLSSTASDLLAVEDRPMAEIVATLPLSEVEAADVSTEPPPTEALVRARAPWGNTSLVATEVVVMEASPRKDRSCATVEEMGFAFRDGYYAEESLRVRKLIRRHFDSHGAVNVRRLPPDQFCRQGFIFGKVSEAGFGNEMYKVLSAAALSIMLNRSLIIGKSRATLPFKDYISYANLSFTLQQVRNLWQKHQCLEKYGRQLKIGIDNFNGPSETNILCSDWAKWKQPIIWLQGTTDAIACQFFLKNIHPRMRIAASTLFGQTHILRSRANIYGELMRMIISPSEAIKEAVNWSLKGGADPDFALHMRMMASRSGRALDAAFGCVKKSLHYYQSRVGRPRIVLISDTPSFVKDMTPYLAKFAEVIHFNHNKFQGKLQSMGMGGQHQSSFRARDWGPAPRWVAVVDFFLASRARYAVISGANRRVGTTYAQLIAALAAANQLGEEGSSSNSNFSFFSSFQSTLLANGLTRQAGWGHVWNRFAGPLSCRNQADQCAFTPLLAPAWWDGDWQSPIPRDIRRLHDYGVQLTNTGRVVDRSLQSYCRSRRTKVRTLTIAPFCNGIKCTKP